MSFDETNLVSNAGLLPAAILAQRIDLAGLIDSRVRLAKHPANSGSKALSVIGSMLVGGDSIDDVAVLRTGATASCSTTLGRRRRSGRGWARTSGPTSASSTRSAASCWPGCGPSAPARPTSPAR